MNSIFLPNLYGRWTYYLLLEVIILDTTLAYLRETLSNHLHHSAAQKIYKKLLENNYQSEGEFVRELEEREVNFLNKVLRDEIRYAEDEQDQIRVNQLNEVYELLI